MSSAAEMTNQMQTVAMNISLAHDHMGRAVGTLVDVSDNLGDEAHHLAARLQEVYANFKSVMRQWEELDL